MSTTQEKISAISAELDKQITLTEESLQETNHTLSLIKTNDETYNQAWDYLASVSTIHHFLLQLKKYIKDGDNKMAQNFIRFHCYQIEQFTDIADLEAETPTGSYVLDAKITVYNIFKSFVEVFDAE